MDNIKDNIKLVDGDLHTVQKFRNTARKRKIKDWWLNMKFCILVILNGGKF